VASLVQQKTTLVASLVQNMTLVTLQFSEQRRLHKAPAKDVPPSSLNVLAECISGALLHMVLHVTVVFVINIIVMHIPHITAI
jgi:hypothetical protein